MKDRGFTLIELLTVISILSIIAIITTPVLLNVVNESTESLSKTQKLAIENAAREWTLKNVIVDEDNKIEGQEFKSVTVKELQDKHYLDNKGSLKNFKIDNDNLGNAGVCIKVKVSESENEFVGFSYEYKDDVSDGNCA